MAEAHSIDIIRKDIIDLLNSHYTESISNNFDMLAEKDRENYIGFFVPRFIVDDGHVGTYESIMVSNYEFVSKDDFITKTFATTSVYNGVWNDKLKEQIAEGFITRIIEEPRRLLYCVLNVEQWSLGAHLVCTYKCTFLPLEIITRFGLYVPQVTKMKQNFTGDFMTDIEALLDRHIKDIHNMIEQSFKKTDNDVYHQEKDMDSFDKNT